MIVGFIVRPVKQDRLRISVIEKNSDSKMSQAIHAEMVALVYKHLPATMLGTAAVFLSFWIIFAGTEVPIQFLLLWSVVTIAVLLWLYTYYDRFKRSREPAKQIHHLERAITIASGTTGLCLGIGGVGIASYVSPFHQIGILLPILVIVVSLIPFLGTIKEAYFSYSIGAVLPIAAWCVQSWQPVYISTSTMLGVFLWASWAISTKHSRNVESAIRANELNKSLRKSYEKLANDEQEVRASEERFRGIFEDGLVGMAILSKDGSMQRVNSAFCRLLGYEKHELIGRRYDELIDASHLDGINAYFRSVANGNFTGHQHECQYRHKDGHDVYSLSAMTTIRGDNGNVLGIVAQAQDVTEERGIKKQLSFQASHDELTGLVNRREFQIRLERIVKNVSNRDAQHVLCYIDLDQFKIVNDTFGHAAGDAMLRQIVNIMRSLVRGRDTLARLGGDEFGIIFENCNATDATKISTTFIHTLNNTNFTWNNHTFRIRASVGLVTITSQSTDIGELLKKADLACYTAKDMGGDQIYVFPAQTDNSTTYSDIIKAVQCMDALYDDRLCLFAQPIVPLQGNDQHAPWYEILLRVVADDGEVVSPGLLIPAAERYGQMASIDRWVIDKTLKEFQALSEHSEIRLSLNLSGISISSGDIPNYIVSKFDEYEVLADRICFELTETATVKSVSQVLDLMGRLKERGCHFALDDFGSGVSSFKYLKQFPFDFLKIDGSLIQDIATDSTDTAMVRAIEQLSASLGLKSIAEWISNSEVDQMVTSLGIDYGQGFLYGKPIPIDRVIRSCQKKSLRLVRTAG